MTKEEQGWSYDRRQQTGCKTTRRERVGQEPYRGLKHHADLAVPLGVTPPRRAANPPCNSCRGHEVLTC